MKEIKKRTFALCLATLTLILPSGLSTPTGKMTSVSWFISKITRPACCGSGPGPINDWKIAVQADINDSDNYAIHVTHLVKCKTHLAPHRYRCHCQRDVSHIRLVFGLTPLAEKRFASLKRIFGQLRSTRSLARVSKLFCRRNCSQIGLMPSMYEFSLWIINVH